jgi:NADPH:quinone reductase-like Zn-dependent oxidoreductase
MKAILCNEYGSPEVLKIKEVAKPVPGKNEILVKQFSTTINSCDVRIRSLEAKGITKVIMRLIMGWNGPKQPILGNVFSGVIEEIGRDVKGFKIGDKVYGANPGLKQGCYAEYVLVNENSPIALKPHNISYDQAASLVFGGTTALHFLDKIDYKFKQSILVYGASGAVGTAVVQISRIMGLHITAVASTRNEEFVRSLGANVYIDYQNQSMEQLKDKFDIVFDAVGKLDKKVAKGLLKTNGDYLTVSGLEVAKETKNQLERLGSWFEEGRLKSMIENTYEFDEIQGAHKFVDTGRKRGTVVLKVRD